MRTCSVCGTPLYRDATCETCGFDHSLDYEHYMSLCPIPQNDILTISVQKERILNTKSERSHQANVPDPEPIHTATQSSQSAYYEGDSVCSVPLMYVETHIHQAELGDRLKQNNVGYCYSHGIGVEKDKTAAFMWYQKAANMKHSEKRIGQYRDGYVWKVGEITVELTDTGVPPSAAQYNLGYCYEHGYGVKQDTQIAIDWYLKSAKQADGKALEKIQHFVVNGGGSESNYQGILQWARKLSESGDAVAQNILGDCFFYGRGVKHDIQIAIDWYLRSAKQADGKALKKIQHFVVNGGGSESNYQGISQWARKLSESGDAVAQNILGDCFFYGRGVNQSYQMAAKWYKLAAEDRAGESVRVGYLWTEAPRTPGNADAQYRLGYCYEHGYGVDRNPAEAQLWYDKAAKQGVVDKIHAHEKTASESEQTIDTIYNLTATLKQILRKDC